MNQQVFSGYEIFSVLLDANARREPEQCRHIARKLQKVGAKFTVYAKIGRRVKLHHERPGKLRVYNW